MNGVVRFVLLGSLVGSAGCGEEIAARDPLVVSMHYPLSGKGDLAMADAMYDGTLAARIGGDFELEQFEPEDADAAEEALEQSLEAANDRSLVIAGGALYADAVEARGCDFEGAMVLQLEGQLGTCPHLMSVELDHFGPAYLAGVMAVSADALSPRRTLGLVTSAPTPQTQPTIDGLIGGAEFAGGTVLSEAFETLQLTDPDEIRAARERVAALLEQVDVVAVVGDAANATILEAIAAYNAEHEPVLLIGLAQDLNLLDSESTLGSILERWDIVVREAILQANADAYPQGHLHLGFRDRVTELYVNPAYADTELDGQPHPDCDACETLEDAVDAAVPRAAARALEYGSH
jgi:basic membrane lipoprotein Med (substrate-binding protein (PBP1-ABC) superfamily)